MTKPECQMESQLPNSDIGICEFIRHSDLDIETLKDEYFAPEADVIIGKKHCSFE